MSGAGTDASSTIPGSIFADDIAPPPLSSESDPQPYSPPPPSYNNSSNGGGGGTTQIEVSSTIQIVLITLGIVVGALFILGVAAAYYISHKNKRACQDKQQDAKASQATAAAEEGGRGGYLESGGGSGEKSELDEPDMSRTTRNGSFSSDAILLGKEKAYTTSGNSYHRASSETESSGFGQSRGGTPGHDPINGSYFSNTTTPTATLAQSSHNPRNSFIEVAQVYAHRQSLVHPVDPSIAIQQQMPISMTDSQQQQQQFLQYDGTLAGATAGSSSHTQWAAPSTENSSLLLDPFKTNNNSLASLNQMLEQGPPESPVATTPTTTNGGYRGGAPLLLLPSFPPPGAVTVSAPLPPMCISYQPPAMSSDPTTMTRPSRRTSALSHQCIADRRSIVGTEGGAGAGTDTGGYGDRNATASGGPIAWHRKRASVVIPEGTIPVRLWKEDAAAIATNANSGTATSEDSPRSPLTSGIIPRIGVVSEDDESTTAKSGRGDDRENMGYRPSVRNGAAVFEGSMPRKPTSRSPSRSRLDDSLEGHQQQQRSNLDQQIDSLGISDAPTTQQQQQQSYQSTYRRKWATGQIAVDDHQDLRSGSIRTIGFEGVDSADSEHVVISLPSPRGCLLEAEHHHHQSTATDGYQQQQQQDGDYGLRSYPIVVPRRPKASSALRPGELASTGNNGGGARFSYLDDYREHKQQKKQ
ncbi:hypothetical protein BGX29_012353 [Mortierella sp. GBA35]|nr:hypothetical protein BGX29_012353 [Mortierella sp. GBA35]